MDALEKFVEIVIKMVFGGIVLVLGLMFSLCVKIILLPFRILFR